MAQIKRLTEAIVISRVGFLVALLAWTSHTSADSDGYYCIGPDYLVYQFSFSQPPEGHHLHVIWLGGGEGITSPTLLALPFFQVHGMLCGSETVEVLARDRSYRIYVSPDTPPSLIDAIPLAEPGMRPERFSTTTPNLGQLSNVLRNIRTEPSEQVPLQSTDINYYFRLDISAALTGPCVARVRAEIVQLDKAGAVVKRRIVNDQIQDIECGE